MNKKSYYQIGAIFMIASGFIYTIERFIAYYSWTGQMVKGSFPTYPELPGLFTNMFLPLFFIIGTISFIIGYIKND
ncbi:hypothetical protein [Clostridium tagluense]|uniref:Uncharacterized protein n=1 Tax=Clostridium tagluense TaxID=360422 RepID=A0A401UMU0_9CLOT|nr:hypothetical protein [Clostridium tagluense]GCD10850.1 hypothetical protein Ctaglu_24730 [Clostridium tagluense]